MLHERRWPSRSPPEELTDGFTLNFPADLNVFNSPYSSTAPGVYVVNLVDDNSHTHQAVFHVSSQLVFSVDGGLWRELFQSVKR